MNKVYTTNVTIATDFIKQLEKEYNLTISNISYGQSVKISELKITVNIYKKQDKATIMFQSKEESSIDKLLNKLKSLKELEYIENNIGSDESGKGDYWGNLVICAVYIDNISFNKLKEYEIKDSKKLSDKKISVLAKKIKDSTDYETISISPIKYNELYNKFNNINKLLAWGHSRAIENLLIRHPNCPKVFIDQFASSKSRIDNVLMKNAKKCEIIQTHHGEENFSVACASIVARELFVSSIQELSKKYEFDFLKGAGSNVKDQIKDFIGKFGKEELDQVGKTNFKMGLDL